MHIMTSSDTYIVIIGPVSYCYSCPQQTQSLQIVVHIRDAGQGPQHTTRKKVLVHRLHIVQRSGLRASGFESA